MDPSDSYLVVERMIRRGELPLSVLSVLLDTLVGQGYLTVEEHSLLWNLAQAAEQDRRSLLQ